jgi:phosphoribosylformimino-5-aminoimidazole carboxamide ribotide isomerase
VILYPAIDIRGGRAVRLERGDYGKETAYDDDPVAAARRWADDGARFLHVVDLDGAREGRPVNDGAIVEVAREAGVPVQAGGGLRDIESVDLLLSAGVERVVLGTAALRDRTLLAAAIERHGERIAVGVDARRGRVALQGWTEESDLDAAAAVEQLGEAGVSRFVFTPIDVDGTMQGPDLEELRRVAAATGAEVIYSGGVGQTSDLEALTGLGLANLGGVIVGKALYEGRFSIAEAQAVLDE